MGKFSVQYGMMKSWKQEDKTTYHKIPLDQFDGWGVRKNQVAALLHMGLST